MVFTCYSSCIRSAGTQHLDLVCCWQLLCAAGIPYQLLNAKPENVERESEIVAQSGRRGSVTISTNMAGRGTDILLGGNPEFMARVRPRLPYIDSVTGAAHALDPMQSPMTEQSLVPISVATVGSHRLLLSARSQVMRTSMTMRHCRACIQRWRCAVTAWHDGRS